ncbi:hypothetical protein [Methanoplanus limicola]|nr:hypothetical protein [Methanoplanus limicola]
MYTLEHKSEYLNSNILNERFSKEEINNVSNMEGYYEINSYESLLYNFLSKQSIKLCTIPYLVQRIEDNNYNNILSLGSGSCVIEHLLSYSTSDECNIFATDFNQVHISLSQRYFKNIFSENFDFFTDNIKYLSNKYNTIFDIAYFQNSAYVMDDSEFIKLLIQLKNEGVQEIIDFRTSIPIISYPKIIGGALKRNLITNYSKDNKYFGKFHGYQRSGTNIKKLYDKAGFKLERVDKIKPYTFTAIIKPD